MLGTKRLALRHRGMSKTIVGASGLHPGLMTLVTAFFALLVPPLQAQRLPLPPNEQEAVDRAIEGGVKYLKETARKNGTWARFNAPHQYGYAALPGLTLLECGVPAKDPIVQRTARCLRSSAAHLDTTYELSLAILFLDRLGEEKDRKIIQTFALRLIAGQSATGGWGYKCPVLGSKAQMELLTALRHLDPPLPQGMPLAVGDVPNLPGIAGKPGGQPGIAAEEGKKPGDLAPIAQVPGAPPLGGVTAKPGGAPLSGVTTGPRPGESRYTPPPMESGPSLWREWWGFAPTNSSLDLPSPPPDKKEPNEQPKDKRKDAKPKDGKPADDGEAAEAKAAPQADKPFIIPERLHLLTVVQNPALHVLQDPPKRDHDLIATTTDNSNTQFAILALWTAQRHGVPMRRTLNLIVRRYMTSQNGDGTWGYHYRFGGGSFVRPGPMTCVGLIGLAVGHGLANPVAGKPVQDPRLLSGFVALSKFVGQPAERIVPLPMQNLYFLWSLERVAVLYNLPTIANKDWYRWGAQILVVNQDRRGNWAGGQYPGSSVTIDTCLALLFLKRANLVKDLTARLPFNPDDLNNGVMEKLAPPPPATKPPEPIAKTALPPEPSKPAEPDNLLSKPLSNLNGTTAMPTPESETAPEGIGDRKKWIALALMLFGILSGGGLFFFLIVAKRKKEEEDKHASKKVKGPKGKRKSKAMASQQDSPR